ncbi:MAG TPA: TonB-dependent receptor [Gammaproteobacteria bacterium]|nr:TonB-dependent receptor [Gammaproteobacteria bacterium]
MKLTPRLRGLSTALGFIAAAAAAPCLAQQSPPGASGGQPIETITVTGSLERDIPQILSQSGTQVDTVNASAIKNGSYLDISQTLKFEAPSLYVSSRSGPFDYVDVSLQGSRTQDVLWLVDGIRINNRLYAGTTPLDTLPASMVDRIEIMQGGQALFYGTEAVAGAINIVTKSFSEQPDGSVAVSGDSYGGRHLDAFFRDTLGKNEFVVYGSSDHSDGYVPFPEADYQPSSTDRERGYRVSTFGGKYAYEFGQDLRFSASYEHNEAKLDSAQPTLVASAFNERSESLLSTKLDYAAGDRTQLFVKAYYHRWPSHWTEFDNVIGSPGTLEVIDDHDAWGFEDRGINAMAKLDWAAGLQSIVGYDFQDYSGSDAVLRIEPQSESVHAVFAQLSATRLPRTDVSLGFRYNMPSIGQKALVWNLSGRRDLSSHLYLKGSLGTSFRLPTAEELFADDPQDERGNPNLKPERSTNLNASIGGSVDIGTRDVDWQLIGFYRKIRDLIDYESFDAATDQDVFGNVPGNVVTRGAELVLTAPITSALSGNMNYTYSRSRMSGSDQQFDRIPKTLLKAGLSYEPSGRGFGANLGLEHVGELYNTLGGGIGRVSYGDYTLVNLGAHLLVDQAGRNRVGITLHNAFDETYASGLRRATDDISGASYTAHYLGEPRTVYVSYTYSFQ